MTPKTCIRQPIADRVLLFACCLTLSCLFLGCSPEPDVEPTESKARQQQSSKPLPDDIRAIENWTESEEYSWVLERCVRTTLPLYFAEDTSLSGMLSLDPLVPKVDGFAYSTTPSFDPETFYPGREKLFGQPITGFLPTGTEFSFDQVFVLQTRFGASKWHFVAPVSFADGTTRRVDFNYCMGRAARKSDYGSPLQQMKEGLEFFGSQLTFCDE